MTKINAKPELQKPKIFFSGVQEDNTGKRLVFIKSQVVTIFK